MLKSIIRFICHKIYILGKFEDQRIYAENRKHALAQRSVIHETAFLSEGAAIYNSSRPKESITIDSGTRLMGDLFLFDSGGSISIGKDCFIGPLSKIWSAGNIKIGDRVLIAHNVNIHDNISHPIDARERHKEFVDFIKSGIHSHTDLKAKNIIIEDDVWIGFNCIVLKGVTIGRGAIIGAGSVVTKDVAPWTVNVGNPLRCVAVLDPVNF